MSETNDKPIPGPLRDRAAAWHARLSSDTAEDGDWLAFEAWLAESPDHLRAYEAVETVWTALDDAPPSAATNVATLRPRPSRRAVWMGAAAASLAVAVGAGLVLQSRTPALQTYETAFGQRRVVQLADGSKVTLNGGSRLAVRLGGKERQVFMADAEAVFDVAKDPDRPFVIQAGDRQIRVVGTEFDVLRHQGEVRVTVRRGVVEVRPAGKPAATPIARLVKGQALLHHEGKTGDTVHRADPDAAMAWTQGQLVFKGETLARVATTLSRYVRTPIVVAPEAQDLPVTAVLNLGDEDAMIDSLSAFLPVQAERQPDSVRLSLRR